MASHAGRINNIFFDQDNAVIVIRHSGCQLKSYDLWKRKLILSLQNCLVSDKGKIKVDYPNLKGIHWALYDGKKRIVRVVATFLTDLSKNEFEITSSPYQYYICLPACSKRTAQNDWLSEIRSSKKMMFFFNSILFQIPLQDMLIDEFLLRSIGYVPSDFIRDGLPHFGSKRDDWKGKKRKHQGYDIYIDKINVIAAADGTVTKVKRSSRSGLYVKLHHGNKLYTLYVHLKRASVKRGQKVKQGEVIGIINGSSGNAIEAQLHFEIKPNNKSVDPLLLIKEFYQDDNQIIDKIKSYERTLKKSIQRRNRAVIKFLD